MARRANQTLILLFVVFLWLPTLDTCFHFDWAPIPSENRLLAAFPKWRADLAGPKEFLAGLEAYFSDHFGCRKCLIEWHNKVRNALFHDKNVRRVLVGSDGWLFLSDAQMIEHFRGALQLTPQQLEDWQRLLEKRRDWLAQRGIGFIFVVAPDKHSIYPEPLPDWLNKLGGRTKLDQFVDFMREHSTVQILDLRPALRAARKTSPTYLKTDTHWNLFGGFIAYQEVLNALARQLSGLTALALTNFEQTKTNAPGGDTAIYFGVNVIETNTVLFTPKVGLPPLETYVPQVKEATKVPAFTDNPLGKGGLIVFRDSFAQAWLPFLGYHFQHVDYIWQYHLDASLIQQKKPAAVVNEMLERFFNVASPKDLMAKDALP